MLSPTHHRPHSLLQHTPTPSTQMAKWAPPPTRKGGKRWRAGPPPHSPKCQCPPLLGGPGACRGASELPRWRRPAYTAQPALLPTAGTRWRAGPEPRPRRAVARPHLGMEQGEGDSYSGGYSSGKAAAGAE